MNLIILVKCIILCICSVMIGFRLGCTITKRPAGILKFTKEKTGEIRATFEMKRNMAWLAHQDTILFEVWNPDNLVPEPDEFYEEKS